MRYSITLDLEISADNSTLAAQHALNLLYDDNGEQRSKLVTFKGVTSFGVAAKDA